MRKSSIKKNYCLYTILSLSIFILSSTCTQKFTKGNNLDSNSYELAKTLLKKIEDINQNSPNSFSLDMTCQGKTGVKKKFRATGNALYNKDPKKIRIAFFDAIFKSPLTVLVQDREIIKILFVIDKTLYIDNADRIDLSNYANIDISYDLIADIISGKIPLIKDYGVFKASNKGDYIILENDDYYETIAFKNNIPDKILFVDKRSKSKTEIYLDKPFSTGKIQYYKRITLVKERSNLRIRIDFSKLRFNKNIDPKKITEINLPKNCKIIDVK